MSAPAQFDGVEQAALSSRPLHLAIGIFDGVHVGHRAVIGAAVAAAARTSGQSAVLTFSPHPSVLLRPEQPTRLMMTKAAKARVLGQLGVETVITQRFTPELAQVSAEAFLPWLTRSLPQLVAIYVGENWRFGRGRLGDVAMLKEHAARFGLSVFSAPRVEVDGEPISSSRIRTLLASGDVAAASRLLGYTYFSEGVVAPGKQLGRTIGFPTLNIAWAPDFQPRFGVYVVRVKGAKSIDALPGIANYGLRPTVENATAPRLEVHVLTECPYDAGDELVVEWLEFVRPEMKFSGLEALRTQIAADRETARNFFTRR